MYPCGLLICCIANPKIYCADFLCASVWTAIFFRGFSVEFLAPMYAIVMAAFELQKKYLAAGTSDTGFTAGTQSD